MSWRTSPATLWARNAGRALGINRVVARLGQRGYEERYDATLSRCVRPGDVVWDIGANIGYYTTRFAAEVGTNGKVVAFEPSPLNFERLRAACKDLPNVELQPCGLGSVSGQLHFKQGDDSLGATSRVVDDATAAVVDIKVGDQLVSAGAIPAPNVIKMDVEGFEGEVLEGMKDCLSTPSLRAIGMEVHFGILESRGLGGMPHTIERVLKAAGFRLSWPDPSHLLASR